MQDHSLENELKNLLLGLEERISGNQNNGFWSYELLAIFSKHQFFEDYVGRVSLYPVAVCADEVVEFVLAEFILIVFILLNVEIV